MVHVGKFREPHAQDQRWGIHPRVGGLEEVGMEFLVTKCHQFVHSFYSVDVDNM